MASGNNIKKLLALDSSIRSTTDPNQAVERLDGGKIRIFFNDGNFIARKNSVNNTNGEVKGIWYFVGNNNYQIKYPLNGVTKVYNFKTNSFTDIKDLPPPNPILQKLMKIDDCIKRTKFNNTVFCSFKDDGENLYWVFWSDGDFRQRKDRYDNREGQRVGTWKLIGENDYQITRDGQTWNFSGTDGWVDIKKGTTWRDVTFTLADVAAGKAVLKRGDKGPAVEELQKLMIQMNLSKVSKSGQPDGKFGKLTELSIRQFQGEMAYGEQDGKVGKTTLKRMYYVYNYDPDKEVDDVQTGEPADVNYLRNPIKLDLGPVPEIPKRTQTPPDDTQNVTTDTKQPELTLPNDEPTTQPKQKLALTPKVVQENIKKIVSENLKSLLK
jgi:peptidoglycan hydrolase-like protein with peptidoglycan-binding domain